MTRRRQFCFVLCLAALSASTAFAAEGDKLKFLIIDGQNNHNWKAMTPPMKASLEATGRFNVEVATTPDDKAPKEA